MGLYYTTAQLLAPAAFLFNLAAQLYGIFSTPNMKDINDEHMSFFSPQPAFIAAFFAAQQLAQLAWLYRLWKLNPFTSAAAKHELDQLVEYVPYYCVGSLCIGIWMFFWNAANLQTANLFVLANTATQLFYVAVRLPALNLTSRSSALTHVVAKSFAGIGVLDLLHNTAAAYYKDQYASTLVKAVTGLGSVAAGVASDWIFGACLVYDLAALAVGQSARDEGWAKLLGGFAVGTAVAVGVKNVIIRPYTREAVQYEAVEEDEA